jgi:SAM-dependent methyltransferase
MADRSVGDFYDEPGMEWSLRSVGTHLHPGAEEATVALAQRAASYGFPEGGVVLEVASALGAPARFLARRFGSLVVCLDMDRRMHAAAVEGHRAEGLSRLVRPILARTEQMPLRDNSCDGAWSQDALCHMDKAPVLREVARVLKPGGIFAFTDFVARTALSADELERMRQTWAFPSLFTLAEYIASLHGFGLEILLAEDRTSAILRDRPARRPDDEDWWRGFVARWGNEEAQIRLEAGRVWQGLLQTGRAGYGMVIVRKATV